MNKSYSTLLIENIPAEIEVANKLKKDKSFKDILGNTITWSESFVPYHVLSTRTKNNKGYEKTLISDSMAIYKGVDILIADKDRPNLDDLSLSIDVKNRQNPRFQDYFFELRQPYQQPYSFGYNKSRYLAFRFCGNEISFVPTKFVLDLFNRGKMEKYYISHDKGFYKFCVPFFDLHELAENAS